MCFNLQIIDFAADQAFLTKNTVVDVIIKGIAWPRHCDTCYGPDASAALAKWYGSTTKVDNEDGGYNDEAETAINADNYTMFAMSVYFQETLSRQAPYEPKDPRYKDIPKEFVDPVPDHPDPFNISGELGRLLAFTFRLMHSSIKRRP